MKSKDRANELAAAQETPIDAKEENPRTPEGPRMCAKCNHGECKCEEKHNEKIAQKESTANHTASSSSAAVPMEKKITAESDAEAEKRKENARILSQWHRK